MDDELEQVNMSLGKTDIEGKGIVITIKDSDQEEANKISASNLLIIVNALKLSGAEAISINDQRIINMSDIADVQEYIKVNGQRILSPYIIKAIGNSTYLESALLGNGGQVDRLQKLGQDAKIEKQNNVKIGKYTGDIKIKYRE